MISDAQLYSLAIFLGSAAMLMIVLYHFLEINAKDAAPLSEERKADALPAKARVEKSEMTLELECLGFQILAVVRKRVGGEEARDLFGCATGPVQGYGWYQAVR
ncbi:hypothetical protein LTR66_000783 [Elasticomyces elasticus]|nr:hypothetical protein LTR66_000783 [Elasticomyces elasticus]